MTVVVVVVVVIIVDSCDFSRASEDFEWDRKSTLRHFSPPSLSLIFSQN